MKRRAGNRAYLSEPRRSVQRWRTAVCTTKVLGATSRGPEVGSSSARAVPVPPVLIPPLLPPGWVALPAARVPFESLGGGEVMAPMFSLLLLALFLPPTIGSHPTPTWRPPGSERVALGRFGRGWNGH
jgi:hypothetical protein